jgi:hypothetical protein
MGRLAYALSMQAAEYKHIGGSSVQVYGVMGPSKQYSHCCTMLDATSKPNAELVIHTLFPKCLQRWQSLRQQVAATAPVHTLIHTKGHCSLCCVGLCVVLVESDE